MDQRCQSQGQQEQREVEQTKQQLIKVTLDIFNNIDAGDVLKKLS
jgi:hypothetical protein